MFKGTLEFFSGFPAILSPDAPAVLKGAKLDGRLSDIYTDKHGNLVEVIGLDKNYRLYVLASRVAARFGTHARWDHFRRVATTTLIFKTAQPTELPVELCFDGSSPYKIPSHLNPDEVVDVSVGPVEPDGENLGMTFLHRDGSRPGYMLSPDLLHYARFPYEPPPATDYKVEYVGIACGPNGNRNVFQRAHAHEKVNEIVGRLQKRYGNRELFIFAYEPGYRLVSDVGGGTMFTMQHLLDALVVGGRNSLHEAMEASLISYFQSQYNVKFRKFPKNRPKWLKGGFGSLNGPALCVDEIEVNLASDSSRNPDGTWSFGRFYSDLRSGKYIHTVSFSGLSGFGTP